MYINKNAKISDSNTKLESIVPYTLYDNANGESGTITLNDNTNNYKSFDIQYYLKYGNTKNFGTINNVVAGNLTLRSMINVSGSQSIIANKDIYMSGTTITPARENQIILNSGSAPNITSIANTYITKVIGYK